MQKNKMKSKFSKSKNFFFKKIKFKKHLFNSLKNKKFKFNKKYISQKHIKYHKRKIKNLYLIKKFNMLKSFYKIYFRFFSKTLTKKTFFLLKYKSIFFNFCFFFNKLYIKLKKTNFFNNVKSFFLTKFVLLNSY